MITYQYFTLDNGLKVYCIEDSTTPMAVVNLLYNVGSRDEKPSMTGFAHLFEHLMFGGSANIPSYDTPLQQVGAENNAFTSPDITNYYVSIPAQNIETALWLESDRMLALSFQQKVLDVQKNVVIEEYKQRYLNQPYGDVWLHLRDMVYDVHPYKWPTIGKEISHIENAHMDDVKDFFYKYYAPNNAILVLAGNITLEHAKTLTHKWFADIPMRNVPAKNLPLEPIQTQKKSLIINRNVPMRAIYKAFHVCHRLHNDYYATDLLSEILGRGQSSRLYQYLVKDKKIFNNISAYITGSIDAGLLVIEGKINPDISFDTAEKEIDNCLITIDTDILDTDLLKTQNQAMTNILLSETELLNKAMNLAYFANIGTPELINSELEHIAKVTTQDIVSAKKTYLHHDNSSVLYYDMA
ncbi:MAG: pitrilysin family protein [Cytophagales bacterium]|nr:pitrilysin family protein [Cytophagales bacterium]